MQSNLMNWRHRTGSEGGGKPDPVPEEQPAKKRKRHRGWRISAIVVVALALWSIVGGDGANHFKYFYLLFLPVVIAATRHGMDGACLVLAATQLALVAVLQSRGYDADAFTDFQTVMFALTMTGLVVGVVVSERRRADLAYRDASVRLKEKEAEAAQAGRFHLLSGMTSALAHEINQPMAAARRQKSFSSP